MIVFLLSIKWMQKYFENILTYPSSLDFCVGLNIWMSYLKQINKEHLNREKWNRFIHHCKKQVFLKTQLKCSTLLIGGSFILRGRFGPVCQRLPIVETSSNWTCSRLTTFNSTAPPSSHSTSTGSQTHDSLSPHFSYKVSTSTGTRTHDSLFSRLVPLPMTPRPPLKDSL